MIGIQNCWLPKFGWKEEVVEDILDFAIYRVNYKNLLLNLTQGFCKYHDRNGKLRIKREWSLIVGVSII